MIQPRVGMVLAAGRGQRLRPITDSLPKPLVEIRGRTLLDHAIDRLEQAGVTRVVVNVHYLADQIVARLAHRKTPEIVISHEPEALETGGGIVHALPLLGTEPFFVVNGDSFWLDGRMPALVRLAERWNDAEHDAVLLFHPVATAVGHEDNRGDFSLDQMGHPRWRGEREVVPYLYAGAQILSPALFRDAVPGRDRLHRYWTAALATGRLAAIVHDGEWYHVSTPHDLVTVRERLVAPGRAMTVRTIPPHRPFLDALVAGLFEQYGSEPLALAQIEILLPTRRACRSLRDAFLRASGGRPLLLPRMTAAGDLDADEVDLASPAELGDALDIPPAIEPLRRRLLLARLIRRWGDRVGNKILPGHALALAGDLARLIDQAHTERVSLDRLEELAPQDLAEHWDITVKFLAIVREHWPRLIEVEGMIDPADRRNRLIEAQIALWQQRPPPTPFVAAGFSSAIPAVADLIAAVVALPQGMLVVPGLDLAADEPLWEAVRGDPTHPQNGLALLLDRLEIGRHEVEPWPAEERPRAELLREMMRPAAVTQHWRTLSAFPDGATDGMTRLDLAGPQEEASTIALLLRDSLDDPAATAMLVTPDRALARRVASELKRWQVDIDDSAGVPLNQTAPGVFLRLLADAALEALAPVPLLALLKHPLAACGMAPVEFREQVRLLERSCLRGPRPAPGFTGLRAAASATGCGTLVARLETAFGAFLVAVEASDTQLDMMLTAHVAAAENLAATQDQDGAHRLWALEAGEALATFIAEFAGCAHDFEPIAGRDYPVIFETALAGPVVRPRWGKHPRLQILGTLEARLQSADLVVLGGLNEGVWPPQPAHDPWMSRQMRTTLGLPSPETQIGVAAQDFMMACGAADLVLTRSVRADGAPTVPSRWLLRLDTVLNAVRLRTLPPGGNGHHAFRNYQALLDRPDVIRACDPPAPRPPLIVRPRRLSVTEIETWMRDPYAIYARHILKLKSLEPLDGDPGAADRGTFIHQALAAFLKAAPGIPPREWLDLLENEGREAFGAALTRPGVWAFWWPRFRRIARWFAATEAERRPLLAGSAVEVDGRLEFTEPSGDFVLRAKADRIDMLRDGGLAVIDYKTGGVPNKDDIRLGFAPQLPLEAAIAEAGGFSGVAAAEVTSLGFWRLSGGDPPADIQEIADPAGLTKAAIAGLSALIRRFDDPATPYRAQPSPGFAPRYSDYTHLARVQEWGAGEAE